MRRALVVRGGWEGHSPVACTEQFLPMLSEVFDVTIAETLSVYADRGLPAYDLIVQCWSEGTLTPDEQTGLLAAVRGGTGFAGWHGGVIATMRPSYEYFFMVGGQFVKHPGGFIDYTVDIASDHEIVRGLSSFGVHTEQYFCHVDPTVDVHATTTFDGGYDAPETAGAVMPVVWTKRYGAGRVFVNTLGHFPEEFDTSAETRAVTERGLLWAARG